MNEYGKIIAENTYQFWQAAANAGKMETCISPDVSYIINYCGNWPNRVFQTSFHEKNAMKRIHSIIDIYRVMNTPFVWVSTPFDNPDNLNEMLLGCVPSECKPLTGMHLPLNGLSAAIMPAGFEIREIDTISEIQNWCSIVYAAFGIELGVDVFYLLSQQDNVKLFLCYCESEPVATAMLFADDNTAGSHFVGTLHHYQKKGLASALTLHTAYEAKKMGKTELVLWATAQGQPVYEKVGFLKSFECQLHLFY